MNNYALTVILKPDLEEKNREKLLESITKKFKKLVKKEIWGVRDLAYLIKHQSKGYYIHCTFEAEPASISPLDKALKLEEDIIRYLLVRV